MSATVRVVCPRCNGTKVVYSVSFAKGEKPCAECYDDATGEPQGFIAAELHPSDPLAAPLVTTALRKIVEAFDLHDTLTQQGDDISAMLVWADDLEPALAEGRRLLSAPTERKPSEP